MNIVILLMPPLPKSINVVIFNVVMYTFTCLVSVVLSPMDLLVLGEVFLLEIFTLQMTCIAEITVKGVHMLYICN